MSNHGSRHSGYHWLSMKGAETCLYLMRNMGFDRISMHVSIDGMLFHSSYRAFIVYEIRVSF